MKRKESILTKKQKVRDSYSTSRQLNFNVNQYLNFEAAAESEISSNNFSGINSIIIRDCRNAQDHKYTFFL